MRAFLILGIALLATSVAAEDLRQLAPGDRNKRTGFLLSKICSNEDSRPLRPVPNGTGGEITEDCLGILQTAQALAGRTHKTLIEAMRVLSPRVSGVKPPLLRQHAWTSTLPATGAVRPSGWTECAGEGTCSGSWEIYAPYWVRFRENVQKLLVNGYVPPCSQDPITWGGPMDDHRALVRGLVRLACGERNRFWVKP